MMKQRLFQHRLQIGLSVLRHRVNNRLSVEW
jgi:hypothetical protein